MAAVMRALCVGLVFSFVAGADVKKLGLPAEKDGLKVSNIPSEVMPEVTHTLTLRCDMDTKADTMLMSLTLLKWDEDDGKYKGLLSLNSFASAKVKVTRDMSADVDGKFNSKGASFLSMEWTFPSMQTTGSFICEASIMDEESHVDQITVGVDVSGNNDTELDLQGLNLALKAISKSVAGLSRRLSFQDELIENLTSSNRELAEIVANLAGNCCDGNGGGRTKRQSNESSTDDLGLGGIQMTIDGWALYFRKDYYASFDEAQEACKQLGAQLAEIPQEKLVNARKDLEASGMQLSHHWIGVRWNSRTDKKWVYSSTGKSAEPINLQYKPSSNLDQTCAIYSPSFFKYMPVKCTNEPHRALCAAKL